MDRDTFLMTVYGLGEQPDRHLTTACPLRHGGFVSPWSAGEVITRVLCGACFTLSRATALFAY